MPYDAADNIIPDETLDSNRKAKDLATPQKDKVEDIIPQVMPEENKNEKKSKDQDNKSFTDQTKEMDQDQKRINDQDNNNEKNNDINNKLKLSLLVIKKLSLIGRELKETYSAENQETAVGFIEARKIISEIKSLLNNEKLIHEMGISLPEREGLRGLLKYLDKKLVRRINAVSGNQMNL